MPLEAKDIHVNKTYRAKRPKKVFDEVVNDRTVLHVSENGLWVQYDSDTIPNGRRYPQIPMEQFLKWASHELPVAALP